MRTKRAATKTASVLLVFTSLSATACQKTVLLGGGDNGSDAGAETADSPCASGQFSAFATNQRSPGDLILDDQHAFWFNDYEPAVQIMMAPISGGAATQISLSDGAYLADTTPSQSHPVLASSIVLDDQNLYWIESHYNPFSIVLESQSIVSMPKTGGATTTLAETTVAQYPTLAAVDGDNFYFVDDTTNTLSSLSRSGETMRVLLSNVSTANEPGIARLQQDAQNLYWIDSVGAKFYSLSKSGGAPAFVTDVGSNFAQDAQHLYWLDDGKLVATAKGSDSPTTVALLDGISSPLGLITVDDVCVYWSVDTSPSASAVMAVPKGGGQIITAATLPSWEAEGSWAADATGVYIASPYDSTILKLVR